jgi:hypothetical protein
MRFGSRVWIKLTLVGAVALGLGGCVYPGDPYYGYGYGYSPAYYYGPPVTGSIFIGGGWGGGGWGGWHGGGWGGRHWH